MRIVLLSKNAKLYSTRRLVEAATQAGHEMLVVDPLEISLVLGGDGPDVIHRGEPLRDVDVVLPRIGTNITEYGVAVVALNVAAHLVPADQQALFTDGVRRFLEASYLDVINKPAAEREFAGLRARARTLPEPALNLAIR